MIPMCCEHLPKSPLTQPTPPEIGLGVIAQKLPLFVDVTLSGFPILTFHSKQTQPRSIAVLKISKWQVDG